MIHGGWQPGIAGMTVITGVGTLDMVSTFILSMTIGTRTTYRLMVHGGWQPGIAGMAIITGVGTLDMIRAFILSMTVGTGTEY